MLRPIRFHPVRSNSDFDLVAVCVSVRLNVARLKDTRKICMDILVAFQSYRFFSEYLINKKTKTVIKFLTSVVQHYFVSKLLNINMSVMLIDRQKTK